MLIPHSSEAQKHNPYHLCWWSVTFVKLLHVHSSYVNLLVMYTFRPLILLRDIISTISENETHRFVWRQTNDVDFDSKNTVSLEDLNIHNHFHHNSSNGHASIWSTMSVSTFITFVTLCVCIIGLFHYFSAVGISFFCIIFLVWDI
jgi:hypothetical protein